MKLTETTIRAGASNNGGWNKEQLQLLGLKWPPERGWITRLLGKEIADADYAEFLRRKGLRSNGLPRKNAIPS